MDLERPWNIDRGGGMSFVCGMVSGTFLDVDHPKTGCPGKHVTGLRLQRNGYRAFPVDKLFGQSES